jgi:hypothetical protein
MPGRSKPRVRESDIQSGIITIMCLDGWHVTVTDPGHRPGQVLPPGYEPGTADLLCLRPIALVLNTYSCVVLYIETKAKDGKVSPAQRVWHEAMRARRFKTLILGEDVGASVEEFKAWYESSGLCRRRLA